MVDSSVGGEAVGAGLSGDDTDERAARLAAWNRVAAVPIVLAAILPIVFAFSSDDSWVADVVYVVSWLVFLADLIVHMRLTDRYLHTWRGRVDLAVVILTTPLFFLPRFQSSKYAVLARLARLLRLVLASGSARRLVQRLGRAFLFALVMVLVCSYITFEAERGVNGAEFSSFSQSLFWGVVTLTTVGYGNQVPVTAGGQWSAVVLMITGVGIIGTLAGSLASFLRLDRGPETGRDGGPGPSSTTRSDVPSGPADVALSPGDSDGPSPAVAGPVVSATGSPEELARRVERLQQELARVAGELADVVDQVRSTPPPTGGSD